MIVVVFAPNGAHDDESLPGLPPGSVVQVVSWGAGASGDVIALPRPTGRLARAAHSGGAVGRELVRLTPADPGVALWRASRRDARVGEAVRRADLVVAAERDGIYAAWRWARTRMPQPPPAVYGYPAARAAIDRMAP